MKAEFTKDENGWIWFFYAKDIYMRKNKNRTGLSNVDAKKKAEKQREDRENAKKRLVAELE
jgi:hypothetical protein